jgi:signal transduction histidine kinase
VLAGSRYLTGPLLTGRETQRARRRRLVLDRTIVITAADDRRSLAVRMLTRRLSPSGDVLVVALSREVVDEAVSRSRGQLILLGAGVLVLAGSGGWLLTRAALRPVERMRRDVRDLEARNAGAALTVPRTRDEIARLAETFNVVLGRMQNAVLHEQALVADAGHELRTPLTVLKGELELARRPHRTRAELAEAIEVAAGETDRLVRLTEDLLFLSRNEAQNRPAERVEVVAVVRRAVESLASTASRCRVELRVVAPGPVVATGDPDGLRRAVENLVLNSLAHAPAGTAVTVSICERDGVARLAVTDDGPGFPPEFLPVAFDRFTRADDARGRTVPDRVAAGGTGLGLAIVRSIAERHGGHAVAANRPGGGAEVTLCWPL